MSIRKGYCLIGDINMKTSKQNKKDKAIEYMTTLEICEDYIKGFREDGKVCFFEKFGGYWAYQEPELMKKIKDVERTYNCLVYAVTHEYTEFGELYDLLIVSGYKEDWDGQLVKTNSGFHAFAYVWNKNDNSCSEFGMIGVQSFGGGIMRCA